MVGSLRRNRSKSGPDMRVLGSLIVVILSIGLLVAVVDGGFANVGDRKPELWTIAPYFLFALVSVLSGLVNWRSGRRAAILSDSGIALLAVVWGLWNMAPLISADQQGTVSILAVLLLLGAIGLSAAYLYVRW